MWHHIFFNLDFLLRWIFLSLVCHRQDFLKFHLILPYPIVRFDLKQNRMDNCFRLVVRWESRLLEPWEQCYSKGHCAVSALNLFTTQVPQKGNRPRPVENWAFRKSAERNRWAWNSCHRSFLVKLDHAYTLQTHFSSSQPLLLQNDILSNKLGQ